MSDELPTPPRRARSRRPPISGDTLARLLHYDTHSGVFCWVVARRDKPAGTPAGYWSEGRGLLITIAGNPCLAQDLAWLWCYGHWPPRMVVHIDGNRANNRCDNLRMCE